MIVLTLFVAKLIREQKRNQPRRYVSVNQDYDNVNVVCLKIIRISENKTAHAVSIDVLSCDNDNATHLRDNWLK